MYQNVSLAFVDNLCFFNDFFDLKLREDLQLRIGFARVSLQVIDFELYEVDAHDSLNVQFFDSEALHAVTVRYVSVAVGQALEELLVPELGPLVQHDYLLVPLLHQHRALLDNKK